MTYDAFISYSHGADGQLAPAVQTGLQRLARPWYRVRALRVFRDETGLAVNPHLWTSIEQALDESSYFVLLASPEAARSPWVAREIDHWLEHKPVERILPVLTDGELLWDADAGGYDFERSTALPPTLARSFSEEPRHLDLRWAHTETDLDIHNPRFREAIAALAAPMHGVSKDEIEGEDVREHRRTIRLVWGAAMLLLFVAIAAVISAGFAASYASSARANERRALAERATARRNAREASHQRTLAIENASTAHREQANAQASATEATRNANEALAQRLLAQQNADQASQNAAEAQANGDVAQQKSLEAQANAIQAQLNADSAAASAAAAEQSAQAARRSAAGEATQRQLAEENAGRATAQAAAATAAATVAESRALAATARNVLDSNGDRALLLAVQARRTADNFQTRDSMLRVLQGQPAQLKSYLELSPTAADRVRILKGSPDGHTVAGITASGAVVLADAVTGARLPSPAARSTTPPLVQFSPDGSILAVVRTDGLALWDLTHARPLPTPPGMPATVLGAAVSADNRSLAVVGPGTVTVVPLDGSGASSPTIQLPARFSVFQLEFSPDGATLAVAGTDPIGNENVIALFNVATGLADGPTLHGQNGECICFGEYRDVLDVQFGSEGGVPTLTSIGGAITDFTSMTWDRETGQVLHTTPTPDAPGEIVVAVSADHQLVAETSLSDNNVRIRDLATGALVGGPLAAHEPICDYTCISSSLGARSVAFLASGEVAVVGGDGIVRIFDPTAGSKLTRTVGPGIGSDSSMFISKDGRVAGSLFYEGIDPNNGYRIKLVDTTTGAILPEPSARTNGTNNLALSADGSTLAVISLTSPDPTTLPRLTVFDVATGHVRWTETADAYWVSGMTFSPDGTRLAIAGSANPNEVPSKISFLDASNGTVLVHGDSMSGLFTDPTFVLGGRFLLAHRLAGDGESVMRFDATTGTLVDQSTDSRLGLVNATTVSADGATVAFITPGNTILLVDVATLTVRSEITLNATPVTVALSPDGSTVVTTFIPVGAQLFDTATGQPLGAPITEAAQASLAAFSADGTTLVTLGAATPIVRTNLDVTSWPAFACSTARRNLTQQEWSLLVGSTVPYESTCPAYPKGS
ncbi:MAG: TIR domain-containing protein [Acidimicrobiia bacterium]